MVDYLILTRTNWGEPPRARHQFTEAICNSGKKVIFVEANGFGVKGLKKFNVTSNLLLYTPFYLFPFKIRFRVPIINEIFQLLLFSKLKHHIDDCVNVIVFDHSMWLSSFFFKNVIYYCNDDFTKSAGVKILHPYSKWIERKLAQSSLYVVATSSYLVKKFEKLNRNIYEIPLASPKIPSYVKHPNLKKPIDLVLLGFLNSRNNINLLEKISENTDYHLHLIGGVSSKIHTYFSRKKNVSFYGEMKNQELFSFMANMHVGLVPYDISKINKGVTPNKLWSYLAVGLPVVITNIPNITNWYFPNDFVYRAETNLIFLKMLEIAFKRDSLELRNSRYQFSQENTWDSRVKDFFEIDVKVTS